MLLCSFGFCVSQSTLFVIAVVINVLLYIVSLSLGGTSRKIVSIISIAMTCILIALVGVEIIGSYISSGEHEYDIYVYYLLAMLVVCCICAILYNHIPTRFKAICYILPIVLTIVAIVLFKPTSDDGDLATGDRYYLIISAIVTCAVLIVAFVRDKRYSASTRSVVYGAICMALSMVLSYIKLWSMPQGGSLTLASMLPILLYAYIFGTRRGIIVGAIYGVLQFLQNPYFMNIYQFALDYVVAFACLGLAGVSSLIKKNMPMAIKFAIGSAVGGTMRYICSVLSGVFAFGMWAPDGQGVWAYSLIYNICILADTILAILVGSLLFSSRSFVSQLPCEK